MLACTLPQARVGAGKTRSQKNACAKRAARPKGSPTRQVRAVLGVFYP